ncbi:MAG: mechanosensitive ion channel protein [Crocinitomicaceae bacterium]|nr:mechanosensitive ion channel protein [Crocinitomicaceae bacterium]
MQVYIDKGVHLIMEYAPKMILALLVLFAGLRVIKMFSNLLNKLFERQNIDITLRPFLLNLTVWVLKAMLFISVASMLGIETTSFVAIIGAAGLAVGLALQGTLANFAGGVLILLFKPYKVGDLVEAQGHFGSVEEIQIFITKLITPENKTVIVPNGAISNGSLINFSEKGFLRVDNVIGISYDSDIKLAKELLLKMMQDHPKVMSDPAPVVAVSELADSSVNLVVRPHAKVDDYWDVKFDTLELGKKVLDEANISIPFPQRDIHMIQN